MVTTQQEQEENIDYSKTPAYDKICQDIEKLFSAGGQTFIPKACDGLREDWYPGVSDNGMRNNIRAQKIIRDKVLENWSNDRGNKTPWGDRRIILCFPKWLRNPIQEESNAETSQLGGQVHKEAVLSRANSLSEELKLGFEKFMNKVPETVIIPEPEPQQDINMELLPEMQDIGENKKDTLTIYGEINKAATNLIKALIQSDDLPGPDDDIFNDYIKPTRAARKSFIIELKHSQVLSINSLQRNLAWLDHVLGDTLEMIDKEIGK